jgi:NADH dehydrogenase (ubiquinone) 1 alpha subcomplex subunit 6
LSVEIKWEWPWFDQNDEERDLSLRGGGKDDEPSCLPEKEEATKDGRRKRGMSEVGAVGGRASSHRKRKNCLASPSTAAEVSHASKKMALTRASASAFSTRVFSTTLAEASANAVRLYRQALRDIPVVIQNYNLELKPSVMKKAIREQFDKHRDVKDPQIVDILVFKGASELEEAILLWKTHSHVMRFFQPARMPKFASPAMTSAEFFQQHSPTASAQQRQAAQAIAKQLAN